MELTIPVHPAVLIGFDLVFQFSFGVFFRGIAAHLCVGMKKCQHGRKCWMKTSTEPSHAIPPSSGSRDGSDHVVTFPPSVPVIICFMPFPSPGPWYIHHCPFSICIFIVLNPNRSVLRTALVHRLWVCRRAGAVGDFSVGLKSKQRELVGLSASGTASLVSIKCLFHDFIQRPPQLRVLALRFVVFLAFTAKIRLREVFAVSAGINPHHRAEPFLCEDWLFF